MIQLCFHGETSELRTGLDYILPTIHVRESDTGIPVLVKRIPVGLTVSGGAKGYEICYGSKTDFFRACAQLAGKLRGGEPEPSISQQRHFDTCGAMFDCSRNAVLRIETVKDLLCKMACMGMNTAMLYTEDTYEVEGYPYFGYLRGAYSKEEIKELDRFAAALGIELIPCIQTLGHLKMVLRWQFADAIKDTSNTLLADEPQTYALIDAMVRTLRECYSSKKIHIGMDEAPDIGLGNFLKKHGFENPYEILNRHLEQVVEIARHYGFEPMMWSDLFFRLGSKTSEYYDMDVQIPESVSKQIPESVSLVYWDYYHEDEDFYRAMIQSHQQMGREIVFAGGVWKWAGMGVNYEKTFQTMFPALEVCRAEGIRHVVATMWGDDGSEVDVYTTLPGMQLFAEAAYLDHVTPELLKNQFQLCLGYDLDAFLALQLDDGLRNWEFKENSEAPVAVSRQVLYQDLLCGMFDKNIECVDLKKVYRDKMDTLSAITPPQDLSLLFAYQRQLLKVLYLKCDLGIQITKAYEKKDHKALEDSAAHLEELYSEVSLLQEAFCALWDHTNKAFGLDRADLRLGGLMMRIKTASRRIRSFLSGKAERIEELDAPKLLYRGDEPAGKGLVPVHRYDSISSASSSGC